MNAVFATIAADRPLRGAVVGAGALGPFWAKELVLSADTELVGWADLDTGLARGKAAELEMPELPVAGTVTDIIEKVAPDFVVNVTAPLAHHAVTIAALETGTPVLSEKPLAATMPQAREMVAAADRAGQLFMISQNRRYMPNLVAYRDTLDKLGVLSSLSCDFYIAHRKSDGHFLFTLDEPLLLDMAIHLFDAARAVTGTDPVSVYCESYNPPWSWFPGQASANAVFEMTGGLRFTLNGSWCSDGYPTSWTGSWRAMGERGCALWDGDNPPTLDPGPGQEIKPAVAEAVTHTEGRFGGLAEALVEFVAALRTGATPQGECHDNLRSLAMCHAAVESARTGQRVPVTI